MNLRDMPSSKFVMWLVEWRQLSVCLMLAALVLSSVGVVHSAHETRQMYAELQVLEGKQDFLDSEYEKLLLEQGAWADYTRVDQVSKKDLGMLTPPANDIIVVLR